MGTKSRESTRIRGFSVFMACMALAACALFGVFYWFEIMPVRFLLLSDGKGTVLEELFLPDGTFSHVYTHSIHLTPVNERFRVEPDGLFAGVLRLYELRYESCGVGMPSDAEGGFKLENGKFILSMDRSFKRVPIRVSPVPGHGIMVCDTVRPFTEWVKVEGLVEISSLVRYVLRLRR